MIASERWKHRLLLLAAATSLFWGAPITAEYLYGYLDSTGKIIELLTGLLILGPLYGAPALLIREVSVRNGKGWRSVVLLAFAFGLFQSGIVDHSLFNLDYGGYDEITEMGQPTFVQSMGISVYNLLMFVGNHVIFSICVPIAITNGVFSSISDKRWLNGFGVAVLLFLYLSASWLVHVDVFETNQFSPSSRQIAVCSAVVLVFCVSPMFLQRIERHPKSILSPPQMAVVSFLSMGLCELVSWLAEIGGYHAFAPSWTGTLLYALVLVTVSIWIHEASKSAYFGIIHVTYLACGALLWTATAAVLGEPMGNVTAEQKITHGVAMIIALLAISIVAVRNSHAAFRMNQEKV